MINKIFLTIVVILLTMFVINWSFNHINPWLSIVLSIAAIYGFILFMSKQIKKHTK